MQKFFYIFFITIFILIIFFSLFTLTNYSTAAPQSENSDYYFTNNDFFWPVPGFHTITSEFGPRVSPTNGASSNHSGIDIAAPEGTIIYSILSGKVSYIGFKGAGGFTIVIESDNFTISYCHVSPNYIINIGDLVSIGSKIGNVGPKYVYNLPNNPYKDSTGKPTNGATTGCHLHLTIRKNGILIDPLSLF